MMPGNNETSDTTAGEAAEDVQAEASDSNTESLPEANGAEAAQNDNIDNAAVSPESDLNDAIDAEVVNVSADPMGFGDQRMGESEEPQDEITQMRALLSDAETKASENWDRLLRLQAEMENQRKRAQADVAKARKFALEAIVGDLLPVKDSLEMGLAAAQVEDGDPNSIAEGAELTLKMLAQVFEKNNILEVNPLDEKFDPEFHQAMSMQEVEGKAANTVTAVMQKGYTLNDRLVRPALVMVAK